MSLRGASAHRGHYHHPRVTPAVVCFALLIHNVQIKPGAIELHPEELALVVSYEVRSNTAVQHAAWLPLVTKGLAASGARPPNSCGDTYDGGQCGREHAAGSALLTLPARLLLPLCSPLAAGDGRLCTSCGHVMLPQVQEISVLPDGSQQVVSREHSTKK